jgi:hypothetical protein
MSDVEEMLNQLLASADLTVPSGALANKLSELILARKIDHIRVDTKPDGFIIFYNNKFPRKDPLREPKKLLSKTGKVFLPMTFDELIQRPPRVDAWIAQGLLAEGQLAILSAKTGSYKTWIMLQLALSIARGQPYFGLPVKQSGVLYIDEENGADEIQRRIAMLDRTHTATPNFYYTDRLGVKLDDYGNEGWYNAVTAYLNEHTDIRLIIIDAYRRVVGVDEDDAGEVAAFFDKITQLVKNFNVTILFAHHNRKGNPQNGGNEDIDELRGSSDLVNVMDVVLGLKRQKGTLNRIVLSFLKTRTSKTPEPMVIEAAANEEDTIMNLSFLGTPEVALTNADECATAILAWMAENAPNSEIRTEEIEKAMKQQGYEQKTCGRGIAKLRDETKELTKVKRGVYKLPKNKKLDEFDKNG